MKNYILYILLFTSGIYAQMESHYSCGSQNIRLNDRLMQHKTPLQGQFLRVMIVYVRFPDDIYETGVQDDYKNVWHRVDEPKPRNPYTVDHSFIDSEEGNSFVNYMDRYRQYTISDYFCEMSRGEFDVIGEEYYVTTLHESKWYHTGGNNYDFGYINKEVLQTLENTSNPDFSRYNNWWYNGTEFEWAPGAGDSHADMIVMVYRNIPGGREWFFGNVSGMDALGIWPPSLYLDGTEISSSAGVTCLTNLDNYSKVTQIWEHEICHRFWNGRHHSIGLMTDLESCTYGMSPFERTDLEYITPQLVSYPYNEIYQDFVLDDFYASGDAVKIQLSNTSEYFWLLNHQKKSVYDGISHGSKVCWEINSARQDPYCGVGKGMYIYHELSSTNCGNSFNMALDIEEAEGKYNWTIDRWVPNFIPGHADLPIFKHSGVGIPFEGKQEYHKFLGSGFQETISDNPCSDNNNDYLITMDWRGDGLDAYNIGYDEIFSPYSNPGSNACNGSFSGLTVNLLENNNGILTIRVYYNDDAAIEDLPPSKPKNLRTSKLILEPSTGRFHPVLNWDLNSEYDFSAGGLYKIYRGVQTACNTDVEPLIYNHIATVSSTTSEYVDQQIYLYPAGGGGGVCRYQLRSFSYKIEAIDADNKVSLKSERSIINGYDDPCAPEDLPGSGRTTGVPLTFSLFQNYPNPFNPTTDIKFELPKDNFVTVKVYNAIGEEVAVLINNEWKTTGRYSVKFDGSNLASGIYFYSIHAGNFKDTKKMVLIK
jgi:hypothetical protein